ncbi:hypothetical protein IFO70_36560 [Phormidium tenue FACHB-886]|nr:hypothetical protein [Phormidium tenue FACHB-886]
MIVFTLNLAFHVAIVNLLTFWMLPIGLSFMQLFFFGTYLPRRAGNAENFHHATSNNYSLIWSFLTCYHLGITGSITSILSLPGIDFQQSAKINP